MCENLSSSVVPICCVLHLFFCLVGSTNVPKIKGWAASPGTASCHPEPPMTAAEPLPPALSQPAAFLCGDAADEHQFHLPDNKAGTAKAGRQKASRTKRLQPLLWCFLQVPANWSPLKLEGDHCKCSCLPLLLASLRRQHHCHTQHLYRRFLRLLVVQPGARRPTDESAWRWRRRALSFTSATSERLVPPVGSVARSVYQRTAASTLAAAGVQREHGWLGGQTEGNRCG